MPSEAARLDPEGRGAARRGGCFNPPQYRPETNLLGFRVSIWTPAGRVKREALDRAKTTSTLDIRKIYSATARAQRVAMRPCCLANSRRFIRKRGRLRRSGLRLGRPARSRQLAVATLPRAPAAGCDNFAASKRRRIVQAKAAAIYSLALAERCSWSKLSRRSVCRAKVAAALA